MHNLKALVLTLLRSRFFMPGFVLLAVLVVAFRFMDSEGTGEGSTPQAADASSPKLEDASPINDVVSDNSPKAAADETNSVAGSTDAAEMAEQEQYREGRSTDTPKTLPKPSFNCALAGLEAERLICGSAELAMLDLDLANVYERTLDRARNYDTKYGPINSQVNFITIMQDQRSWIRNQRNRCSSEQCLHSSYRARINYLSDYDFR